MGAGVEGRRLALLLAFLLIGPCVAGAQAPAPPVELGALQDAAIQADPRYAELRLLAAQSDLRQRNIATRRLPSLSVEGTTQYQSDVPSPPTLPGGVRLFNPPHATYDGSIRIDQPLFDATLGAQTDVEQARLVEQQAGLQTRLFALRQQVNDAFFAAATLQERERALRAGMRALEARLDEARARVQAGTALASDAAAIEAALLEQQQDANALVAERHIALLHLGTLTQRSIAPDAVLTIPDAGATPVPTPAATQGQPATADRIVRPEIRQFEATKARLEREQEAAVADGRPRVSAFARLGYGRPGLNFIGDRFDAYGLGGVRVQWRWWTWGTTGREQEALQVQQQITDAEQASFVRNINVAVEADRLEIARLEQALVADDRIVSLREQIERVTGVRFGEGATTASEYVDRQADLLRARSTQAIRRVALAQVRVHLLTTLGMGVR